MSSAASIRINKRSSVPLRQQLASQIEFLIATGKLKPGEPLPSVRALGRQLRIHRNTVSKAYRDVTSLRLVSRKPGSRLVVRVPEERAATLRPDLDDLINQTIHLARQHGYLLEALSARVRQRLAEEPPDHVLALSFDAGMQRLLKREVEDALRCHVEMCSPQDLLDRPERALGAVIAAPAGALPAIIPVLPKNSRVVPVLFASAESHLQLVRTLTQPSIVAVATVSEQLLEVARGLLGPAIETRHTLIGCLFAGDETAPLPSADLLFCDVIISAGSMPQKREQNLIPYRMISQESLERMAALLSPPNPIK
jgi:DNA-binding transcriptional regulator YhcF (GntR family)